MTTPAMRGVPSDWSKDGRFLLFSRGGGAAATDLMAFDTKTKVITPILATTFDETDAQLSPDARVLAYASNESGTVETYLRPFVVSSDGKPSLGPKWRVSTAGGSVPRWRGDGKELFFRGPGGEMMAADVVLQGGAAQTGLPRKLFTLAAAAAWDVMPDGQRFLMSLPANPNAGSIAPPDPITIVLNWQSGLIK